MVGAFFFSNFATEIWVFQKKKKKKRKDHHFNHNNILFYCSSNQCKSVDYFFRDPGYEYPPDPEICFSKYKRDGNDDDVDNEDDDDDDDDDFDVIKSYSKNCNKINGRNVEKATKLNMSTGEYKFVIFSNCSNLSIVL